MAACAVGGYSLGCLVWAGLLLRGSWSRRTGRCAGCGRGCGRRLVAGFAVGGRRAMTGARGGGAGGRSTWGDEGVCGGRRAAGGVQAPRGGGRACAVGAARLVVHAGVRAAGGVAGDALLEGGGLRADAGVVVHGRADHRAVVVDERARQGDPLDSAPAGRDRRALLPGRAALHHRRCRPRHRAAGLGREGRDKETVSPVLRRARPERRARLELVSSDMGEWITRAVAEQCPQATLCLDPFHIVALASDALDEVRREVWNEARRQGDTAGARFLKGSRWALWKRPERLTERQQLKLATDREDQPRLFRAYLLKEQLRLVFHEPDPTTRSRCSRPGSPGHAAAGSRASSSSPRRSPPTSKGSSRP